ncbi:SH3 domain-containing protein [Asticcacaulis sp. 201]|uniref:SH3 domain-containing protein n=1 Tax=Asticcacaulis sp. 201 TaxID=3028787 RepID=UPI00291676C0|nr:SH3 domain-containing protein [Asticcacaulis sp. 201]MDV6332391.1 SH3 domain-containing protein [Asticcacaulis sp. 201]
MRQSKAVSFAAVRPWGFDINALRRVFQVLPAFAAAFWLVVAGLTTGVMPAHAEETTYDTPTGLAVPRWAMLRKNEVYARNGPSKDNRIVWTYRQATLPVQIISETRDWRLICDPDGGVAWVARSMIQAQKTVMSPVGQKVAIRKSPSADSDVRATLRPRSLASLDKCKKGWCRISADGQTGWAPQSELWGTQTAAVCKRPDPFAPK